MKRDPELNVSIIKSALSKYKVKEVLPMTRLGWIKLKGKWGLKCFK